MEMPLNDPFKVTAVRRCVFNPHTQLVDQKISCGAFHFAAVTHKGAGDVVAWPVIGIDLYTIFHTEFLLVLHGIEDTHGGAFP